MNKLQGYGIARVRSASIETPKEGGKTFLGVFVEFSPRQLDNGKVYTQRLAIRSYQRDMSELVQRLKPGVMVSFVGEVDAYATEKDGKTYANPRLVGRLEVLDLGQGGQSQPQQQTQPRGNVSAKSAASAAGNDGPPDDDVPF
jgi:hypothetical protein